MLKKTCKIAEYRDQRLTVKNCLGVPSMDIRKKYNIHNNMEELLGNKYIVGKLMKFLIEMRLFEYINNI